MIRLSVHKAASGLLDEPFALRATADPRAELVWRGRYRDDDGRVWRASAPTADLLGTTWAPAKPPPQPVAALQSLRPISVDVRVEASDGRSASRTLTRRLLHEGVRVRRWKGDIAGTLYLPAEACATVIVPQSAASVLAAPLLASRGVLVLALASPTDAILDAARERLSAVPAATEAITVLDAVDPPASGEEPGCAVILPPNVGARDDTVDAAQARAAAWDALLAHLGARPREQA